MLNDYNYEYQDDRIYCYPGTGILINKFDIKDKAKLHEVERDITAVRLVQLEKEPISGLFNFYHLKAIHKYLFSDIYEWAGEIRKGDFLAKGDTVFCRGQFIETYANSIFTELDIRTFKTLSFEDMISKTAYFMGEINALHPFREGNGRALRAFFSLMLADLGYEWDMSGIDRKRLLQADINAFVRNYAALIEILNETVKPI